MLARVIVAILLFAPSLAAAQGWKAEWEALIDAAKKEGAVAVAGSRSPDARRVMVERWQKDFPGIQIEYTVGSSTQWMPRMMEERKAGKFLWDIFATGPSGGLSLSHAGALAPMLPLLVRPDVKESGLWEGGVETLFIDDASRVMGPFQQPATVYYDSAKVSPQKVERLGLAAMLEPEAKGRIAWQDPRVGGPGENYSYLILHVLGESGLKRILVDQQSTFFNAASEATTSVVRGRHSFVVGVQASTLEEFQKQGLGTSIKPMGTGPKVAFTGTGGMVLAAIEHPAHPAAQKLFVNWFLTKEIQELLSKTDGLNSMRKDVEPHTAGGLVVQHGHADEYLNTSLERLLPEKKHVREIVKKYMPN
jgi:ABC-type glycerol-3-phosphate transport system substrate-binding protein